MHQWDGDKSVRIGLVQTPQQTAPTHTRVDQYTGGAAAKDGEYQSDEFNGRPDHQNHAVTGANSEADQATCKLVHFGVEPCEGHLSPGSASPSVSAGRKDHGRLVRDDSGGVAESVSDVQRF
jgi:hypothetical protein